MKADDIVWRLKFPNRTLFCYSIQRHGTCWTWILLNRADDILLSLSCDVTLLMVVGQRNVHQLEPLLHLDGDHSPSPPGTVTSRPPSTPLLSKGRRKGSCIPSTPQSSCKGTIGSSADATSCPVHPCKRLPASAGPKTVAEMIQGGISILSLQSQIALLIECPGVCLHQLQRLLSQSQPQSSPQDGQPSLRGHVLYCGGSSFVSPSPGCEGIWCLHDWWDQSGSSEFQQPFSDG